MSTGNPGFDINNLKMDSKEKQKLSDQELRMQIEREKNDADKMPGNDFDEGAVIQGEAISENLHRAIVNKDVLLARIGDVDVAEMKTEDKEALSRAYQEIDSAREANRKSKNPHNL